MEIPMDPEIQRFAKRTGRPGESYVTQGNRETEFEKEGTLHH